MLKAPCSTSHSGKNLGLFKQAFGSIRRQASSQQILNDLQLPEGLTIGKAVGGGDCFFDSVAQGLKQLKPGMEFTIKSLRQVCKKLAVSDQRFKEQVITDVKGYYDHTVLPPCSSINDDELWNAYLIGIEYTIEDVERMRSENPYLYQSLTNLKYGNILQVPIWGRSDIEGIMICSEYNVKLHIIENLIHSGWSSQLIDGLTSRSVSTNYNEKNTIHIINKGNSHFEPILKKKVQQMLPSSGLTQAQSGFNELSLINISRSWESANEPSSMNEPYEKFTDIIEDSNLLEHERIEKLKDFFKAYPRLDVNFQVNRYNDSPLHIAVCRGELKTVKFLLRVGARIDISNREGKTPIDIAEGNNRKDIAKILQPLVSYKEVDVPGDGSCLFWSVALAYLTPVKFDDYNFRKRFKKLFANDYDVQVVQRLMQDNVEIYKDNTLRELVTEVFRSEVIDEMCLNQRKLENKITMEDFLESRSGDYFTGGAFKKEFERKFGAKKVKQYNINTSKLQPNFFDKNTIEEISTELDKIQKRGQVQEFLFERYLKCMEMPEAWGGKHEINTISKLLETTVIIYQNGLEDYVYNREKKYCSKIHLSYKNEQHYQFYQVEYSNLMKFVLSFVELFEMKLAAYDVLGSMLRQEKRMFPQEIDINKFVLSIFGISAYTGKRTMLDVRTSLKRGNITKAAKGFISLSDLIEVFKRYKLGFRKILVDAGCNIFQSFEMQFDKIGFNQISKVVDDITDKIIEYYIQKEYGRRLDYIGIAEALVFGKYSQEVPDVQYGEKSYNLRNLYENIGIVREVKNLFSYYIRSNNDKSSQYGYRRFLMGERLEITYTKTETTNLESENYVYAFDSQDFKSIVEQAFYIVNQEVQAPNTKKIEDFVAKIKSHIEQEVNFLSKNISFNHQKRKQSLNIHMRFFKETGKLSESQRAANSRGQIDRAKKNSKVIFLMEENLKKIPNSYYCLKIKEVFTSHAETISQDYSNLFESQCTDTIKSKSLWSRVKAPSVKAVASLLGKMNFKDVCAPVEEFTGRQEQIEEMYAKLQEGAVVIVGPSGVGKTQLARKYVDANKKGYLHAYEINAKNMLSIENSFTSFIRDELAISMEEEDDKGRKKYLFLFQGVKKEDVEKILKIKNKSRGGFDYLFTSLDQDYKDIAEVTLDILEEEQAEQLVKKILEIADKSQDEQIEVLVKKLKGFPLAIKLAATCIKNRKSSALVGEYGIFEYFIQYEDFDQALPKNTGQNEYDRVLQITLLISIKAMREVNSKKGIPQVLSIMAYFGSDQIDPNLFLTWIEDDDELYSTFELLEQYSIIRAEEGDEYKVYVMHELVKKVVRSQLSIDEEKQVLSHAIKLMCKSEEDFYPYVEHCLSLFYYSQEYESLARESCHLAHMILSILNTLCEYKKALAFGLEALKVLITTNTDIAMARYEIACTKVALGEYDSALKIFFSLKEEETLNSIFSPLSLDREIIFIYFKQKHYEDALFYVKSDNFLLIRAFDEQDQYYVDNYLSIVNTVTKIFVMQARYTDAFTMLHYERELRDEIFLKRNDFDLCNDPYLYPSDMYEFYNLEAKYTYALVCFFIGQDREKITIEEEMLPHKEDLPRELSIQALLKQLQDVLKNQEGSQYLQPAPYSVERKIGKVLQRKSREETLQRFEAVLQLQKDYGLSESHHKVLSVKFYISLLHNCLDDRKKALQELQELQKIQEKVIGLNHPDTLATVSAIQELFTKYEDRSIYLRSEMEKRESLLQHEKSDLNADGVSILKEIYVKGNSNNYPSVSSDTSLSSKAKGKRKSLDTENTQVKSRKIGNQQQLSSCLDSINVDLSRQQDARYQY